MTQKVKKTCNKISAIGLIVISLFFFSNTVLAQDDLAEFEKGFAKTIHYPDALKNSCTPSFANLLIDISENGSVLDIMISDSAPKLLKDEFNSVKGKINNQLLEKIIADKKLKNCGIIIPLFYVYGQDYCTNSFADFISDSYLTFESKRYNKLSLSLSPIMVSFYKPVY